MGQNLRTRKESEKPRDNRNSPRREKKERYKVKNTRREAPELNAGPSLNFYVVFATAEPSSLSSKAKG